ncbi:MAG: acetyl-CoA carboxylase biotin carboxylase subunit [Oscillospiraceae bacterium]
MFNKVLIANRGEIAVRIIRACRELGLRTVAVCSEADRSALHAQIADETICIGPAPSKDSYLHIPAILSACELTGAQAIHPGFGFLSENAAFARQCQRCGITFVGPSPDAIERMGNKARAKQTMAEAGVPVIPGSDGPITTVEDGQALAKKIGFPLLVKASAGGGGRGIRLVEKPAQLEEAVLQARQEAESYFGDPNLYLEKFLLNPRHVEVQILADSYGNTIHLGERDCSLQRRNQKILEECPSPSPLMTPQLREEMGKAAIRAAQAVNYRGAGTVEFLLDGQGNFYFMEMNTRIQVEHPVTEMATGVDLVKWQLLIAMGRELTISQEDVRLLGHAIECRINAENPEENFRPSPGTLRALLMPGGPGIRVDAAIYAGYTIPPYYDSMMAKLIAFAPTRQEAIAKMRWALAEFVVDGVDTNIDFQLGILRNPEFETGDYHIGTLSQWLEEKQKC